MGFLSTIAGIASAAGAIKQNFGPDRQGSNGLMNDKQYDRYQQQLNRGNPQDIARNNSFLRGTVGAESDVYNQFRDSTYANDSKAMKDRMDTLYAGTTPWERLGAPKPDQIQLPGLSKEKNTEQMGQLTAANATTAAAKISADATKTSAALGALSSLGSSGIAASASRDVAKTNLYGTLDKNSIERIKADIAQQGVDNQLHRWNEMTSNERGTVLNNYFKILLDNVPKVKLNTAIASMEFLEPDQASEITKQLKNNQSVRFNDNLLPIIQNPNIGKMIKSGTQAVSQEAGDITSIIKNFLSGSLNQK